MYTKLPLTSTLTRGAQSGAGHWLPDINVYGELLLGVTIVSSAIVDAPFMRVCVQVCNTTACPSSSSSSLPFWQPGGGDGPGRPRQQPAALLHRQRRHPAAVFYPPSQWRYHRPHCTGPRAGSKHDSLDSTRPYRTQPRESEKTLVLFFLFHRRRTTR